MGAASVLRAAMVWVLRAWILLPGQKEVESLYTSITFSSCPGEREGGRGGEREGGERGGGERERERERERELQDNRRKGERRGGGGGR